MVRGRGGGRGEAARQFLPRSFSPWTRQKAQQWHGQVALFTQASAMPDFIRAATFNPFTEVFRYSQLYAITKTDILFD